MATAFLSILYRSILVYAESRTHLCSSHMSFKLLLQQKAHLARMLIMKTGFCSIEGCYKAVYKYYSVMTFVMAQHQLNKSCLR